MSQTGKNDLQPVGGKLTLFCWQPIESTTLAADYPSGSGSLTVANSAGDHGEGPSSPGFQVQVLDATTGATKARFKVTAIPDGMHLTIGSDGPDANCSSGDIVEYDDSREPWRFEVRGDEIAGPRWCKRADREGKALLNPDAHYPAQLWAEALVRRFGDCDRGETDTIARDRRTGIKHAEVNGKPRRCRTVSLEDPFAFSAALRDELKSAPRAASPKRPTVTQNNHPAEPSEFQQRAEAAKQLFWSKLQEGKPFEEAKGAALSFYEFSPEQEVDTCEWFAGTEAGERRPPLSPAEKQDHQENLEGLLRWFDRRERLLDEARAPGGICELQLGKKTLTLLVLAKMVTVHEIQIQDLSDYGFSVKLSLSLAEISALRTAVTRWGAERGSSARQDGGASTEPQQAPAATAPEPGAAGTHPAQVAIADTPASTGSQELPGAGGHQPESGKQSENTQATAGSSRRRGRPVEFSQNQLDRALTLRLANGSNLKIAQALYNTKTPSAGQQRGVSTILTTHFPDQPLPPRVKKLSLKK